MKTSFATIVLSLAGAAFAAPAAGSGPYPYSVDSLTVKHTTEDKTWHMVLGLTYRDDSAQAIESTTCYASWVDGADPSGPTSPKACADPAFTFWFPNGVGNLDNYDVLANGPEGTAGGNIASGPKYQCGPYEGHLDNVDKECKITNGGQFYLKKQ
ncbi:hypothetical protein N7457_005768 [Penicillium paradoxum]|uniref:uncharacterized protein n=1 Tax=Penicillium paradoxum TaxID=176176 RepID=UPI00254916A8|nr:uncharacterized protein N7457_005768 [Penicillium paradoxum]KAJ5780608.1 hypothetical protein N7457_005768 [Penicillium paradoxum]